MKSAVRGKLFVLRSEASKDWPAADYSKDNLFSSESTVTPCPLKAIPRACPFGGACHTCPTKVQTKLTISQPGDIYEQADRIAEPFCLFCKVVYSII